MTAKSVKDEQIFHDAWADSEDAKKIDVKLVNTAVTSPELRWIHSRLGDLKGKSVLDVGCGFGEFAIYAAVKGANSVALDLSANMLLKVQEIAKDNGVSVETCHADSDYLELGDRQFDVIYCGNLLHHVDVNATMKLLSRHLKPGGKFVSWDPLKYNPVINIYRVIAAAVRTDDEHPLGVDDVDKIRGYFSEFETRFFWLSTLIIFIAMVVVRRKNPAKTRFWKDVVYDHKEWSLIYRALKPLDAILCRIPGIKWLSWNIAIIGTKGGS